MKCPSLKPFFANIPYVRFSVILHNSAQLFKTIKQSFVGDKISP